jgi:hypothetical protein
MTIEPDDNHNNQRVFSVEMVKVLGNVVMLGRKRALGDTPSHRSIRTAVLGAIVAGGGLYWLFRTGIAIPAVVVVIGMTLMMVASLGRSAQENESDTDLDLGTEDGSSPERDLSSRP